MNLISKHLQKENLKIKIKKFSISQKCAFTGLLINEGVDMKDLIKNTFTDQELIKYPSKYASVDIALLIEAVIPSENGLNAIRNYSFYADETKFELLKRENILNLLLSIPHKPFHIGITYSNKKHIAYKSPVNYDSENYQIITDLGVVNFEKHIAIKIIEITQKWYTVLPDKKDTQALQTYFTKEQIKGFSNPNYKQIESYGIQKYFKESQELDKFRETTLFNLIIHCLNKKI